jgi:hypothetical protein
VGLFIGISLILSFAHPNFHLSRILEVVVTNHNDFVKISHGNNLIHFNRLEPTWMSMIINSPWAMISGLFRPFPGEGQGVLEFAASVENLFLLLLVVSAVIKFRKMFVPPWPVIALAALSYCVVLCVFLALSSPNLGTLSRYRIGFLPFFVFLVSYRNPWVHWIFSRWESKRF